jgi:hypothetical protein
MHSFCVLYFSWRASSAIMGASVLILDKKLPIIQKNAAT